MDFSLALLNVRAARATVIERNDTLRGRESDHSQCRSVGDGHVWCWYTRDLAGYLATRLSLERDPADRL